MSEPHVCNGQFRLPNSSREYREPRVVLPHGETTLYSAIVRSCNVYFYGLGVELDIDRMEPFMKAFGFGALDVVAPERMPLEVGGGQRVAGLPVIHGLTPRGSAGKSRPRCRRPW